MSDTKKKGVQISRHTGGAYADTQEVIESELARIRGDTTSAHSTNTVAEDNLLTLAEVEKIETRCDAATPGAWRVEYHDARGDFVRVVLVARSGEFECGYYVIAADEMEIRRDQAIADYKSIASAHTDIPRLCVAYREALRLVPLAAFEAHQIDGHTADRLTQIGASKMKAAMIAKVRSLADSNSSEMQMERICRELEKVEI